VVRNIFPGYYEDWAALKRARVTTETPSALLAF
jgi:hypothetical protein